MKATHPVSFSRRSRASAFVGMIEDFRVRSSEECLIIGILVMQDESFSTQDLYSLCVKPVTLVIRLVDETNFELEGTMTFLKDECPATWHEYRFVPTRQEELALVTFEQRPAWSNVMRLEFPTLDGIIYFENAYNVMRMPDQLRDLSGAPVSSEESDPSSKDTPK